MTSPAIRTSRLTIRARSAERPDWCSIAEDDSVCCCRRVASGGEERTDSEGATFYLHRLTASPIGTTSTPPQFTQADGNGEKADADTLNKVYTALLEALSFEDHHADRLRQPRAQGVTCALPDTAVLVEIGFSRVQR